MSDPAQVPRQTRPLADVLPADFLEPGHWVLGLYEPRVLWWRCPSCEGVVPLSPYDDIDADGLVEDPVHGLGNVEGTPFCEWRQPLRLRGYDPKEARDAMS